MPASVYRALTIAGSDSSGGAGIQADLKTFAALGVHGTSVVTCITAQNPKRVLGIEACSRAMVRKQLEAVFAEMRPAAAKTGMLYLAEIIEVVAEYFRRLRGVPLVVDPVMVATSGNRLLKPAAVRILRGRLLPLAALVTPNLAETAVLTGKMPKDIEDMRGAAREIYESFGCAVLVKGGHLPRTKEAADIFFDGRNELLLTAPFVAGIRTHGTGCTYSAAITAQLALGLNLPAAVTIAKGYITQAIAQRREVAGHSVLNPFWR